MHKAVIALLLVVAAFALALGFGIADPPCVVTTPNGVWALQIDSVEGQHIFWLHPEGYFAISAHPPLHLNQLDWQPFLHIRQHANQFCITAPQPGQAELYINQERAWRGPIPWPIERVSIAFDSLPSTKWVLAG